MAIFKSVINHTTDTMFYNRCDDDIFVIFCLSKLNSSQTKVCSSSNCSTGVEPLLPVPYILWIFLNIHHYKKKTPYLYVLPQTPVQGCNCFYQYKTAFTSIYFGYLNIHHYKKKNKHIYMFFHRLQYRDGTSFTSTYFGYSSLQGEKNLYISLVTS